MFIVRDEADWEWMIDKGDPGYDACRILDKIGFLKQLALPRSVIVSGSIPAETYQEQANDALDAVVLIPNVPATAGKYLRQRAESSVRLATCLSTLRSLSPT